MTRQAATRPFGNDLTSQAAATMKAVRAYARGGPEQIVFGDVPVPRPEPEDALVRVHAAAITPTELCRPAAARANGTRRG